MKRSSASRSNTNVIVSLPQKFVASASAPSSTTNIPSTSCSSSLFDALWPCAFYLSCSLTMNILTKALITSYGWHFIYSLGAIQNIFTFTVLSCYKLNLKWKQTETNDSSMKKNKEPSLLTQTKVNDISFVFRIMVPLVCLNIGNMILGFASLQLVNMPM
jgi:hypothetical protein